MANAAGLIRRITFLSIISLILSGCILDITAGEGGSVLQGSVSGEACDPSCTIDTTTASGETFHAVAAPGFEFTGWNGADSLCNEGSGPVCTVNEFATEIPYLDANRLSLSAIFVEVVNPIPAAAPAPGPAPTAVPTAAPTAEPTEVPTEAPPAAATPPPTSPKPTAAPTAIPTAIPTPAPATDPTPTAVPSPTVAPTPTPLVGECPADSTNVNFASVTQDDGSLAPRELTVGDTFPCQATGTDSEGNALDFSIAPDGSFDFVYVPLIAGSPQGETSVSGLFTSDGSVVYKVCAQFLSELVCITYDGLNDSDSH